MDESIDRKYPRIEVKATMDLNTDDLLLFNRIENLSMGGACVTSMDPPQVIGSQIEMAINLPDKNDEVVILGEVVWTSTIPKAIMGVRFLGLDDGVKTRLKDYLSKEN